ncbi:hypothetical protein EYF80_054938 [Liparis tanakae]|uniref:Uncharacterized protein n=1 Tax=Liparis tanakae TaxID=230148 RepID=A0A4Z2F1I4_9TELE|nr:hypothetical protein EYF80_054938 [Liparis tanakae]
MKRIQLNSRTLLSPHVMEDGGSCRLTSSGADQVKRSGELQPALRPTLRVLERLHHSGGQRDVTAFCRGT